MAKIKIGINGFGRIGKLIFRASVENPNTEVVAINDPGMDVNYAKYMLEHDSIHGAFKGKVKVDGNYLVVNGKKIRFFAEREPNLVKWKEAGAEYIAEASGRFVDMESASLHLKGGAKKVIITAPGKNGVPMYVMGVNHNDYKATQTVVSNASCTTNCLAPLVKVINDNFGIAEALMSTVHSTTASQLTVDGPSKKDWRGGRAASYNIIPSGTGAAKAVSEVIPELKGKITGKSFRVPTLNVSVVDLTCKLAKPTTYEKICKAINKATKNEMAGIMAYTDDDVVSSDFIGNKHTCIFDEKAGIMLNETFVQLVAWYDNEWAYSCKVLDLITHMAGVDAKSQKPKTVKK